MGIFNLKPSPEKIDGTRGSEEIPMYRLSTPIGNKKSAEELMEAYRSHPEKLTIEVNGKEETLKGLKVDLSSFLPTGQALKVFVAFGVEPNDLANPNIPVEDKGFTTIFFKLIDTPSGEIIDSNVNPIDFCDPCPPKCPKEPGVLENGVHVSKLGLPISIID
jgi:hypothetical protein